MRSSKLIHRVACLLLCFSLFFSVFSALSEEVILRFGPGEEYAEAELEDSTGAFVISNCGQWTQMEKDGIRFYLPNTEEEENPSATESGRAAVFNAKTELFTSPSDGGQSLAIQGEKVVLSAGTLVRCLAVENGWVQVDAVWERQLIRGWVKEIALGYTGEGAKLDSESSLLLVKYRLYQLGYFSDTDFTAKMTTKTTKALKSFQADYSLEKTGKADWSTVSSLMNPVKPAVAANFDTQDENTESIECGDVRDLSLEELTAEIQHFPKLKTLTLTHTSLTAGELKALQEAFPEIQIEAGFQCFGKEYFSGSEYAVIEKKNASADEIRSFLSVMGHLTRLELFDVRISNDDMTPIIDEHPEISFGWTINFIGRRVRNDITAISTLGKVHHTADYYEILRYFTNLKGLDLGHNRLGGVDFLRFLPDLDVLILVDDKLDDEDLAKIVQYTPNLRYLELWDNQITDLSPLVGLTQLREINLYNNQITDLTPLCEMTWLERCFVHQNPYPKEQEEMLCQALPNTVLNFEGTYPTAGGWRGADSHYESLRRMFKFSNYHDLYAEE